MRLPGASAILVLWFGLLFVLAARLPAQHPAPEEGRVRFVVIDLYVDSGSTPLAAYQIEFSDTNRVVRITGIEGGEPQSFRAPPAFDPKAMQSDRAILAAFSTDPSETLPLGKVRVATLHLQVTGERQPAFKLSLQAAADSQGRRIPAQPGFEERKSP